MPKDNDSTAVTSEPAETSPLEGLEDLPVHPFSGVKVMARIVNTQSTKLCAGGSGQYVVFRSVGEQDFEQIDRERRKLIGKNPRISYYPKSEVLIVKSMPLACHQTAQLSLGMDITYKIARMGTPRYDLLPLGGSRFGGGPGRPSKEADLAYRSQSRRGADWPTIVFESGVSESLRRLRHYPKWWLGNSGGEVKIVILILVDRAQRRLQIEKWELAPSASAFYDAPNIPPPRIPTKMQEVIIDPNAVTGAPLVLDFEKMFLRAAIPPEGNIEWNAQELSDIGARYWSGLQ
jgi:hypothetical protein